MSRATANVRATARRARRDAELTRKSQRMAFEPRYFDFYARDGSIERGVYRGHALVLNRGIQRKPGNFATLMASVRHLDLTRASGAQLAEWAEV